MHTIEAITEPFTLPEDALCLTPQGWKREAAEIIIQLEGPATLDWALKRVWEQHHGLLGAGHLSFKQTALTNGAHPKGYLIFVPSES